jgi:hypothetical protein
LLARRAANTGFKALGWDGIDGYGGGGGQILEVVQAF